MTDGQMEVQRQQAADAEAAIRAVAIARHRKKIAYYRREARRANAVADEYEAEMRRLFPEETTQ